MFLIVVKMSKFGHYLAIFLVLLQMSHYICNGELKKEADKPYIDYLTTEYLNIEQHLWHKINGRYNIDYLFDEVRSEHQKFVTTDFGAEVTLQNAYVPSAGILLDNVNLVNALFYNASVLLNSPILSRIDIGLMFKNDILPRSVQYSEFVYRESSRANFWQKGKDVRGFFLLGISSHLFFSSTRECHVLIFICVFAFSICCTVVTTKTH